MLTIEEYIEEWFCCELRPRLPDIKIDLEGLHTLVILTDKEELNRNHCSDYSNTTGV